jgi:pimeloyl-ACP methyl ester carboxylesterase
MAMRGFEQFYAEYLIGRRTPGEVLAVHPTLRAFWYDTTTGQYGRSATYFHEVQALDVDGALARIRVPALFIGGEFDWVMGSFDAQAAARSVNRLHPGLATARVYPRMSHGLHDFASAEEAFRGRNGRYDGAVARDVVAWLR